jgi:hypothetical protein
MMARFCILVCRCDDEQQPEALTQLARLELPALPAEEWAPATALDQCEARALATGREVTRHLFRHQWEALDAELAAAAQRLSPPVYPAEGRERSVEGGHLGGDLPPGAPGPL